MSYPRDHFESEIREQLGLCFVMMPFAKEFNPTYELIKAVFENPVVGFKCTRADEILGGQQIMSDILAGIGCAQLVIADLTSRNPNVFYELGIAHMAKPSERVLLLSQSLDDVPFDLRGYRCIIYRLSDKGRAKLKAELEKFAMSFEHTFRRFSLKEGACHDTGPLFPSEDRCLCSIQISDTIVGSGFAKLRVRASKHVPARKPREVEDDTYGLRLGETRRIENVPCLIRLDEIDPLQKRVLLTLIPQSFDFSPAMRKKPSARRRT